MRVLAFTLFVLLMSCRYVPAPTPIEPEDTVWCAAACAHLRAMSCPEGEPLDDGTSCEVFCVETQESGHALHPSCVVQIKSCGQVNQCLVPRISD